MASSNELDPAFTLLLSNPTLSPSIFLFALIIFSFFYFNPGGVAWACLHTKAHRRIPGPPGIDFSLSTQSAHRALARTARSLGALRLMSFSVGFTRFIISSHPETAKEILSSSAFADRPVKESAYELLFHRAMGFAPFGEYWRNLRRISATYLFSPRRVGAFGDDRKRIGLKMVEEVRDLMGGGGEVEVRRVLHFGSLSNVMASVFGKRFDFWRGEGLEVEELVREGYELLGLFNWGDHLPFLGWFDLFGVRRRCRCLVGRVNAFVGRIIEEHRERRVDDGGFVDGDFVDVLLGLEEEEEEEERLSDSDMIAILWVRFFRIFC